MVVIGDGGRDDDARFPTPAQAGIENLALGRVREAGSEQVIDSCDLCSGLEAYSELVVSCGHCAVAFEPIDPALKRQAGVLT
jgi:hypothetical protein